MRALPVVHQRLQPAWMKPSDVASHLREHYRRGRQRIEQRCEKTRSQQAGHPPSHPEQQRRSQAVEERRHGVECQRGRGVRNGREQGVDNVQQRGVGIFERLAVKPEREPGDVRPTFHQEPADAHERSLVRIHVLREFHAEQTARHSQVHAEQQQGVQERFLRAHLMMISWPPLSTGPVGSKSV